MLYQVPKFGQKYTMSCWAASMRMILAWNGTQVASDDDIASPTGHQGSLGSGLDPNDGRPLTHWGFTMEAPQCYMESALIGLVRDHGPLWIACDVRTPGYSRSVPHIRVIRGVREAASPTLLMVNDPGPVGVGSQYDESFETMMAKNELLGTTELAQVRPIYIAYLT